MILRVTTDLTIECFDYPKGSAQKQNKFLVDMIGDGCEYYEVVRPVRLYEGWNMDNVVMLVDEEGLLKGKSFNSVGSYLYEYDVHGSPIVGNVVFVGMTDDKTDICDLDRYSASKLMDFLSIMKGEIKLGWWFNG